jgi:hypothetical protein
MINDFRFALRMIAAHPTTADARGEIGCKSPFRRL